MSRRLPVPAVLAAAAVVLIAVAVAFVHGRGTHPASAPQAGGSSSRTTTLVPASSRYPASGVCGRAAGSVLTVRIEPDAPAPMCTSVAPSQSLRVVNGTGDYGQHARRVTVRWRPGRAFTLAAGESKTFPAQFGSYLARGVHDLTVVSTPGYRAEIWLH
jgi:hypothetical protein